MATASPAAESARCTVVLLPQAVRGQLCLPANSTPRTVQLLVHGSMDNRGYWDLPDGDRSYQRDMATSGYATFAIDRLGSGDGSQPLRSADAAASVVHQVVGMLRSGAVGENRFGKVVLTGHSTGAGIVVRAAATYRDADGVVLTGMTERLEPTSLGADVPVMVADGQQDAPLHADDHRAAIRAWIQGNVDL
ncbi:alpha/beta hydrolase [Kibdelosporangium phytohabitans]|uniref:AB hydrolase-1 domain-containing protein n=1 Tax=Kibdelosporangium phytohabitans TaxID=860235 RepID=A0A0N9IDR3_9PSEU|nr:alpha/beta fold hydrolase [Kibdelosporangium phytohabitans]ALG12882.1 hypothetical protein AOZ06_43905 [Kibdelosporangium phytohabitans]MBE1464586.1 pimeloyl-ACP methyl ester carboxylesterase [Kibdelosporangium phytohabitans]